MEKLNHSNKINKLLTYFFATKEDLSLEHRLLIIALIIGLIICILGAAINYLVLTSWVAVIIPLVCFFLVSVLFYFARVKKHFQPIAITTTIFGITAISAVWVFNDGINGSNMMPAFIILMLGIIIVPEKVKKYIFILFVSEYLIIMLIQLFWPDLIVHFPSETYRWSDHLFTFLYSSLLMFLIVRLLHKNYDLERLRAEENEKKFRILYDHSPDMLYSVSLQDNTLTSCNETFLTNLGYSKEEIIGKPIIEFYDIEIQDYKESLQQFLDAGYIMGKELIIKKKNGIIMNVSLNVDAIRDEHQKILYSISSLRDITERKRAELKIIQHDLDLQRIIAEKDKFFSIIAHDLRGPFSGFLGLSESLAKKLPDMTLKEIQEITLLMRKSAVHLSRLLENLLEWSRLQRGMVFYVPKTFFVDQRIAECLTYVNVIAIQKEIVVRYDDPNDLAIYADEKMVTSVLQNLLSNAVKYSRRGGVVTISTNKYSEDFVEISVKDTGIGMSREIIDQIFRIDVRSSRKGTEGEYSSGLGLIICQDFIHKNGGELWIESEEGVGSTFRFTIPCPVG